MKSVLGLDKKFWIFVTGVIVLMFLYDNVLYLFTRFTKVVTVAQKYVVPGRYAHYVIVDSENQVYYLTKSYVDGNIDVVQQYAMITPGQKHTVRGYGVSYPLLNMYLRAYDVRGAA